jgi:hypothetical protein
MIRYTIYCVGFGAQCAFVAGGIATNGHPSLLGALGLVVWGGLVWTQLQLVREGTP